MLRHLIFMLTFAIFLSGCGGSVDVVDTDDFSFQELNYPGADFTELLSVNNVGQVLGRYKKRNYKDYENDPWVLFVYDMQTKEFAAIPIEGMSSMSNTLRGVDFNDVGQLVMANSGGLFYDITSGQLVVTDPWVTPTDTRFVSINNAGQIVGWHFSESFAYKVGFLYDIENMQMTYANYPGARNTQFFGINDTGHVIARYTLEDETTALVLYDSINQTFVDLDIPVDTSEWDVTINNNGVIVAKSSSKCSLIEVQQGNCWGTVHTYDTVSGAYTTKPMPSWAGITGYSNNSLQLVGTVNQVINLTTGGGESTGLLATPK